VFDLKLKVNWNNLSVPATTHADRVPNTFLVGLVSCLWRLPSPLLTLKSLSERNWLAVPHSSESIPTDSHEYKDRPVRGGEHSEFRIPSWLTLTLTTQVPNSRFLRDWPFHSRLLKQIPNSRFLRDWPYHSRIKDRIPDSKFLLRKQDDHLPRLDSTNFWRRTNASTLTLPRGSGRLTDTRTTARNSQNDFQFILRSSRIDDQHVRRQDAPDYFE